MEHGAKALLLLLAAIAAVQLFQGGPGQLKEWTETKFLGKTKAEGRTRTTRSTAASDAAIAARETARAEQVGRAGGERNLR